MRSSLHAMLVLVVCMAMVIGSVGCYTVEHTIGKGPVSGGASSLDTSSSAIGIDSDGMQERQWYALWGLVRINTVDGGAMAGGAADYRIKSQISVLDAVINFFTSIATVYCQTVTVTK